MSRLVRALPQPLPTAAQGGEEVSPVRWRGLNPAVFASTPQQIGLYDRPPLNNMFGMAPQLQRKSGWPMGNMHRLGAVASASPLPHWQQTQQLGNYPGTQRAGKTSQGRQMSRFQVTNMRQAITQQQVQQSGPALLPFIQAVQQNRQGIIVSATGGQ